MAATSENKPKQYISVGILAHVDAGKTTLSEGILYLTGQIRKLGRVDHGDAFLDMYTLERSRGITIFSKQANFVLGDKQVTLLDTPGHVDFSAEMERTLQVLDYAILVVSGADGVQGHTRTLWNLLARYQVPTFIFINKMDQDGTDRQDRLTELKRKLSGECVDFTEAGEEFLEELPSLTGAYPEETRITAPIETWSDDFSIAIAGIPSMVNDFTGGSFMETNYHSQFDNDGFYDEDVYRMHHELFGLLLMAIDRTVVVPLDFSRVFRKARERLDSEWCEKTGADGQRLLRVLEQATVTAQQLYAKVEKTNRNARHADASAAGVENASGLCTAETGDAGAVNGDFTTCVQGTDTAAEVPAADTRKLERSLLQVFQQEQDTYVRIDWYGNVLFPHGILQDRLQLLEGAVRNLKEGRLSAALRKLYEIDSNRYAFLFEEEVYRHFTSYALDQSADRLKWGTGRIIGFENFFPVVTGLLEKEKMGCSDFTEEIAQLEAAYERQSDLYRKEIDTLCVQTERMERFLREAGVEFYGQ